jgi:predicted glycoside hydrolase/deacetylase ChbG (UPF0249 family)
LLIINADDLGVSVEANDAIAAALAAGAVTTASVMVPAPAFSQAAEFLRKCPEVDVGVHLTVTSEWPAWRWKPVLGASVPSLLDKDGFLPKTVEELFQRARLDEVEAELRAQIDLALASGIDLTHLDSHMFVLHCGRHEYYSLYLKLARRYQLPLRAINRTVMSWWSRVDRAVDGADALGLLYPEHLVFAGSYNARTAATYWTKILESLPEGLSEIYCHPGYARGDLARFASDLEQRQADADFFTSSICREVIERQNIKLMDYRRLRDAMRNGERHRCGSLNQAVASPGQRTGQT